MAVDVTRAVRDPDRLAAVRRTGLLDTPPEEVFDRLTRRAVALLQATAAMVTLVEEDRQFFKSCIGLPEPWASQRQTPLSHSLCQYAVALGRLLVIDDARCSPRLRDNLAIRDLGVIAYAGVPLTTADGQTLGDFCVIDAQPRWWTEAELALLRGLAATAMAEIERRQPPRDVDDRASRANGPEHATAEQAHLAARYALGLLAGHELASFARHLGRCARCQRTVDQDRDTLAALSADGPQLEASPGFKARVLEAAARELAGPNGSPVVPPPQGPPGC